MYRIYVPLSDRKTLSAPREKKTVRMDVPETEEEKEEKREAAREMFVASSAGEGGRGGGGMKEGVQSPTTSAGGQQVRKCFWMVGDFVFFLFVFVCVYVLFVCFFSSFLIN